MTTKRILITGANSYVGTSFEKWLSQWPDKYHVDTIDMIDGTWREKSFKGYDVIFHVAGIAHRKETKANAHEYYEINRDLAVETAKKANQDGVSQFIFMSTMGVYGMLTGVITKDTVPNPKTHYGKSKLQAEEQIRKLSDDSFKVVILRPPMIYGKNCTGNYQKLAKLVRIMPVFPDIDNKRSMIYIENLSAYIKELMDFAENGTFLPQNSQYVCTKELVAKIAEAHGKSIHFIKCFSPILKILIGKSATITKVFGSLYYSVQSDLCDTFSFAESVRITEYALTKPLNGLGGQKR
ncbi:NAD-dependent epimerase/dehydratase family protein [uncultured Cloacibacillus sp.]|uniref:NAD-dependent epimerase/dehydratase family protein n=1 Tax=uncultured Cloacibacillus sp. TaxID=889794 RepID=UPI0026333E59|nr:NAD-dependent epimerase/dehydratase family protein [uncultured Cloacibacillus sp.]